MCLWQLCRKWRLDGLMGQTRALAGLNGELKMKRISGDGREVDGEENRGILKDN